MTGNDPFTQLRKAEEGKNETEQVLWESDYIETENETENINKENDFNKSYINISSYYNDKKYYNNEFSKKDWIEIFVISFVISLIVVGLLLFSMLYGYYSA